MKLALRLATAAALTAAPALSLMTFTTPAAACGNSYRYELDPKTNMVVKAEEALHEGDYATALRFAVDATGAFGRSVEGQTDPKQIAMLRARGLRVAAIASVRTNGTASLSGNAAKTDPAANLTWAVAQLRVLAQREANPYLQARLAEGLAKSGASQKEALDILHKLAADDLMPDAAAWQLLAQLEGDAGHAAERDNALTQCKTRASDPSICKVKAPGEG